LRRNTTPLILDTGLLLNYYYFHHSSNMNPPGPLTFLNLPTEIRRKIYKFVFAGSKGLASALSPAHYPELDSRESEDTQHSILLTCRQCHNEALQLYMQRSTWILHGWTAISDFAEYVTFKGTLNLVKHIELEICGNVVDGWAGTLWYHALQKSPALETVTIKCTPTERIEPAMWTWRPPNVFTVHYYEHGEILDLCKKRLHGPRRFVVFIKVFLLHCDEYFCPNPTHLEVCHPLPRTPS
jgi:hypothetical protein